MKRLITIGFLGLGLFWMSNPVSAEKGELEGFSVKPAAIQIKEPLEQGEERRIRTITLTPKVNNLETEKSVIVKAEGALRTDVSEIIIEKEPTFYTFDVFIQIKEDQKNGRYKDAVVLTVAKDEKKEVQFHIPILYEVASPPWYEWALRWLLRYGGWMGLGLILIYSVIRLKFQKTKH
ncbi:hypothetical protein IMZ31_23855 (plasmid) [Pontibacillus sp. ALD_SL1]|uniref:hypothetical protein n=1 Tax=Pontibacillus sp. ALD_SL1 TaxID=2777185 RepID=UPI001A96E742|nr:hypothetical protein [Pontibacillus sp. ALD_SL1]QST02488.1 hypothetical protein IMZ31_23855 [Pontibacillus sp. ALD_SL1]